MKIILVDDHEMVLTSLAAQLEKFLHAEIYPCTNSRALFRLLGRTKANLLFLDIHLREENGLDLLSEIKKKQPALPVVMLSAAASFHTILQAQQLGAQGFIAKDDGIDALVKAANELPSNEFYLSLTAMRAFHPALQPNQGNTLSPREIEIIGLFAEGLSYKEIAQKLEISPRTVETHRNKVLEKLEAKSIVEVIRYALKNKLID